MKFVKVQKDLFGDLDYLLNRLKCEGVWHGRRHKIFYAQCISADRILNTEINKQYEENFCIKDNLDKVKSIVPGDCIFIDPVFNLVIKPNYFDKPTYQDFGKAIRSMKDQCVKRKAYNLVIPTIGSTTLGGMNPYIANGIIQEIFFPLDIRIFMYTLPNTNII